MSFPDPTLPLAGATVFVEGTGFRLMFDAASQSTGLIYLGRDVEGGAASDDPAFAAWFANSRRLLTDRAVDAGAGDAQPGGLPPNLRATPWYVVFRTGTAGTEAADLWAGRFFDFPDAAPLELDSAEEQLFVFPARPAPADFVMASGLAGDKAPMLAGRAVAPGDFVLVPHRGAIDQGTFGESSDHGGTGDGSVRPTW